MKTALKLTSAILAIVAAIMGLVAPRGAITSFLLVLSALIAIVLLVSSFKGLKAELAEAKERREASAAEAEAAKAAEEAEKAARQAVLIAEAVKAALSSGSDSGT